MSFGNLGKRGAQRGNAIEAEILGKPVGYQAGLARVE